MPACVNWLASTPDVIQQEIAAIIDSQSVKTQAGGVRGFDGAKKTEKHFPRVPRIWADQGYTGGLQKLATKR